LLFSFGISDLKPLSAFDILSFGELAPPATSRTSAPVSNKAMPMRELLPLVYEELGNLAAHRMANQASGSANSYESQTALQ